MNNLVIFAAAGNGKTYSLCREARKNCNNSKKALLLSYTNEGVRALETEYKKQNNGIIDNNIEIKSWYKFLLTDFIKPYQCLLSLKYKHYKNEFEFPLPENYISSIAFYDEPKPERWFNKTHIQYYINHGKDLYLDNVSNLAFLCNENNRAINRLEDIYSHIFIDELQDYAGWDLEIIKLMFESKIQISCVGDYKQATYRTNNSTRNKQYRDEKIRNFFLLLEKNNLCKIKYALTTRRFNSSICQFINTIHNDPNAVVTVDPESTTENAENIGVFILNKQYASKYCEYYSPTILRYDISIKIPFSHSCNVFNYGGVKGATFDRVVVIPIGTVQPFLESASPIISPQTRSKFYVACTRAKHSVVIIQEEPKETNRFKPVQIQLGDTIIPALKFI